MAERYLPRWAADEIADLKRDNDRLRSVNRRMEEALAGDGAGLLAIARGVASEDLVLPGDVHTIRARLANGFELTMSPSQRGEVPLGTLRYNMLQVMVTSHHGLAMYPQAGNVIHMGPGRA